MEQQAREIAEELREICVALRPPQLDDLGLVPALDWLCSDFRQRGDLTVDFVQFTYGQRLPSEVETAFYRVAQEALNNCERHSGANTARVTLASTNGRHVLRVSDHGKGMAMPFSNSELLERGHLGLVGMQERLNALDGELRLESPVSGGLDVVAIVDLNEAKSVTQ